MDRDLAREGSGMPRLWSVALYCLIIAAGCLLICSKSSPLYPINDWSDANIYFSMGKGMARGRVIYRDLYDHKGPLLYGLHALCAWISPLSFLGVWLLEILCLTAFLVSLYQHLRLYGAGRAALLALPLAAALVTSSYAFQQGDSAEEFCLPLLSFSLLWLLRYLKEQAPGPMPAKTALACGVLCGCVLWMKFTMLGLHLAWIVIAFGIQAQRGQWKAAWRCFFSYAAGIALATLPWVLYFGLHGALGDWLKTYFYDNLFLYSGSEAAGLWGRGKAMARSFLTWGMENWGYLALLAAGMLRISGLWLRRQKAGANRNEKGRAEGSPSPWERAALWLGLGLLTLGVFIGGKSYPYYGLILYSFMGVAFTLPALWAGRLPGAAKAGKAAVRGLCAGAAALSFALCLLGSPNVKTSFLQPKESTMQYRLAAVIGQTPDATLLNYGFMDAGFYTASGIVPSVKYFHQTNVPLEEMLQEQSRYLQEGLCTYVVTRGKQPETIVDRYDLVATAPSPGFWYDHVELYRLKGE
ncbi:MAG: hypothetical protein VB099_03410 [Candidatus Limiplasma sp.]|nr:hypothetical protein [Candidatus Limiplasma sp.]